MLNNLLFVISEFLVVLIVVVVVVEGRREVERDKRAGDIEILSILSTWIIDCKDVADINFVVIKEEEEEVVVIGMEERLVEDPSIPVNNTSNDWNEYSVVSRGDKEKSNEFVER